MRCGLLEGFDSSIKTMDVDFLVRNLRRPTPAAHLVTEARERGYLVESDRLTGVTKLYTTGGLEAEFLICKVGAGVEDALRTNLGVTAQALRHLDTLSRHVVTVDFAGLRVNVPTPEAYVVHKMIVNNERGRKQEKDALAIQRMWPFLDYDRLAAVLGGLTKREGARVASFMEAYGLMTDSGR